MLFNPDSAFVHAERDLGLIPENASSAIAIQNRVLLNAALAGMWKSGSVTFANGNQGPILTPIFFPGKEYFFSGIIETSYRLGASLIGVNNRSYILGSDQYSLVNGIGGMRTQFTRIDGQNGGAVIRLRNHGTTISGITIFGRKYSAENGTTGMTEGTPTPIGIEVEGRTAPATGGHIIRDCLIAGCTYGIACRHGYHDPATNLTYAGIDGLHDLHYDESHADSSSLENVRFFSCPTGFYSENVQAIIWSCHNLRVSGHGADFDTPMTLFDIRRGGNIYVDGIEATHPKLTILSVGRDSADWPSYNDNGTWKYKFNDTACPDNNPDPHDYSPGTSQFDIRNIKWDGFAGNPAVHYLTLFKYAGPNYMDYDGMQSFDYWVRMTGHSAHNPIPYWGGTPDYDYAKLVVINDTGNSYKIPRTNLLFDFQNLPKTNFTKLGDGPWWYPN